MEYCQKISSCQAHFETQILIMIGTIELTTVKRNIHLLLTFFLMILDRFQHLTFKQLILNDICLRTVICIIFADSKLYKFSNQQKLAMIFREKNHDWAVINRK